MEWPFPVFKDFDDVSCHRGAILTAVGAWRVAVADASASDLAGEEVSVRVGIPGDGDCRLETCPAALAGDFSEGDFSEGDFARVNVGASVRSEGAIARDAVFVEPFGWSELLKNIVVARAHGSCVR